MVVRGLVRRVVRGVVRRVVRGVGSVGSPRSGGQFFQLSRCVYVLRCFVCLVIVMSCTFDTTFKELVASSKTLRLSSR